MGLMERESAFATLVHDLTDNERSQMLERLRDITSEEAVSEEIVVPDEQEVLASSDPVIFRLGLIEKMIIFFKALFGSQSYEDATQDFYIQRLSRKLDKAYGRYFSLKEGEFYVPFARLLGDLVEPLEMLRPVVARAFKDRPRFIAFLSGWVLPVVQTRLLSETDPQVIADELGLTDFNEIR